MPQTWVGHLRRDGPVPVLVKQLKSLLELRHLLIREVGGVGVVLVEVGRHGCAGGRHLGTDFAYLQCGRKAAVRRHTNDP